MRRLVLLIDVGTQSTRIAVAEGGFLHVGRCRNKLLLSQAGYAEQAPEEWWNNVVALVQEALKSGICQAGEIACVAVCAQMHAPVGLTEQKALVADRVQLWCDKRSSVIVDELSASEGLMREVQDRSGNSFTTAWMAPKIVSDNSYPPPACGPRARGEFVSAVPQRRRECRGEFLRGEIVR